jgi:lipopolysaccharide/colanic/teichoic acid biosynthesis glycosyltransferase
VAIAIRLESSGPIIFRRRRVGLSNRQIRHLQVPFHVSLG